MQVSNFPEKAEEYLTMADDIEDNIAAKSQVATVNKMSLLSRGDELDSTRDNVRLPVMAARTSMRASQVVHVSTSL